MKSLNSLKSVTLEIANALFLEKTYSFSEEFLDANRKDFHAKAEEKDFKNGPQHARRDINKWVEEKTRGKISDLLGRDDVRNVTRLIIVNAVYFLVSVYFMFRGMAVDGFFREVGRARSRRRSPKRRTSSHRRTRRLKCR